MTWRCKVVCQCVDNVTIKEFERVVCYKNFNNPLELKSRIFAVESNDNLVKRLFEIY